MVIMRIIFICNTNVLCDSNYAQIPLLPLSLSSSKRVVVIELQVK